MTDMDAFIAAQNVKMAILAVPAAAAQQVVNELVAAGLQAILNFSPTILDTPERAQAFRAHSRQVAAGSPALWHAGPRGLVRLTHQTAMAQTVPNYLVPRVTGG